MKKTRRGKEGVEVHEGDQKKKGRRGGGVPKCLFKIFPTKWTPSFWEAYLCHLLCKLGDLNGCGCAQR